MRDIVEKSKEEVAGMNTTHLTDEPAFLINMAKRADVKFVADLHYHNTYEMYYLASCTRRQFVEHTIYDMKKGDLILIPEAEIQKAAEYIYENFNKPILLKEVADYVHMSENYFSKRFKIVTGINFSDYLISTRLRAADELLLNTKKSILKIAESCGFSDANYFGDVFKKRKGVSLSKYRKLKTRV